jgi:hypothetical protein
METLVQDYFPDLPQGNPIVVGWGRRARNRLGAICNRGDHTTIHINRLFALPEVPEFVVDAVLAHELAHYVHGFGSGLPKIYAYPHAGGVVDRELDRRGLRALEFAAKDWEKRHWAALHQRNTQDLQAARTRRRRMLDAEWQLLLNSPGTRPAEYLQQQQTEIAAALNIPAPPASADWLKASRRMKWLSYRFSAEPHIRVHGLAALPSVPSAVVRRELAYWICMAWFRGDTAGTHNLLLNCVITTEMLEADRWVRRHWERFRVQHHP